MATSTDNSSTTVVKLLTDIWPFGNKGDVHRYTAQEISDLEAKARKLKLSAKNVYEEVAPTVSKVATEVKSDVANAASNVKSDVTKATAAVAGKTGA